MDFDLPSLTSIISNSFYSEVITRLFAPQGGQPINLIILSINGLIFLAAFAYGLFHYSLVPFALMRNKSSQNSRGLYLALTRSAIVLLLLFPGPQSGQNLLQNFTIIIGAAGNNGAQRTWNLIRESLFDSRQPIYSTVFDDEQYYVDRLVELQTCLFYSFITESRRDFGRGFTLEEKKKGTLIDATGHNFFKIIHYDSPGTAWNDYKKQKGFCGSIRFPDLSKFAAEEFGSLRPAAEAYQENMSQAYIKLSQQISQHVAQFALANHPFTASEATIEATIHPDEFQALLTEAKTKFIKERRDLYNVFATAIRQARINEYVSVKNSFVDEWIQAGGYYQRIASFANFQHNIIKNSSPTFTAPLWDRIWPNPEHHVLSMRTKLSSLTATQHQDLSKNYSSLQFGQDFGPTDSSFIEEKLVGKLRKMMAKWAQADIKFTDPMSALTSKGYTYLGMYAGIFVIVGSIAAFAPPLGFLAWEMTGTLRGFLLISGTLLAFLIPLVPYILFIFGIVSWLLPFLFFYFVGSIWLIPNIRSDGNVAVVGNGWTTLLEIFFRPILLIAGLSAAYGLFTVIILLIENTLGTATVFSFDTIEGLVIYAFLQFIYGIVMGFAAIGSFMLIILVPNAITQYLPQEGNINA